MPTGMSDADRDEHPARGSGAGQSGCDGRERDELGGKDIEEECRSPSVRARLVQSTRACSTARAERAHVSAHGKQSNGRGGRTRAAQQQNPPSATSATRIVDHECVAVVLNLRAGDNAPDIRERARFAVTQGVRGQVSELVRRAGAGYGEDLCGVRAQPHVERSSAARSTSSAGSSSNPHTTGAIWQGASNK